MSTAGVLDPGFGAGRGFVLLPVGVTANPANINEAQVAGVAVQADGKILIGGTLSENDTTQFLIERLNADGTVDSTFARNGLFVSSVSGGLVNGTAAMALQADGKIVEAGSGTAVANNHSYPAFVGIRVNSDGTLDPTFGPSGADEAFFSRTILTGVNSAAIQADGKIILGGPTNNQVFGAVRINADGLLDTTFGNTGTASVAIAVNGYQSDTVTHVAIQSDGKILLAGDVESSSVLIAPPLVMRRTTDGAIVRLDAAGVLDPSFGGTSAKGIVLVPPSLAQPSTAGNVAIAGLAVQPDNAIVLAAGTDQAVTTGTGGFLQRLAADGTVDTAFGTAGRAPSLVGPVLIQSDGKVVVTSTVSTPQPPGANTRAEFATRRFNPDGMVDTSYGNTSDPGESIDFFGAAAGYAQAKALAIQADGNIILAGTSSSYSVAAGAGSQFVAARVLAQPSTSILKPPAATPPASFDGSGRTDLALYLPSLGKFAYRPVGDTNDQLISFGPAGTGQTLPVAADFAGEGQVQVAAYLPAYGEFAIRPTTGPDRLIPFGFAGSGATIPTPADFDGDGKADIAAYLPALGAFAIRPSTGGVDEIIGFGFAGNGSTIPVTGDFDGDGKADIAAYLPALGAFAIRASSGGSDQIIPFGQARPGKSIPVPGDYDGSGKTELAVYFPALGLFAYRPANGGADVFVALGSAGDGSIPVVGDYSGSGKTEFAVFDPNYAAFAYRPANGGADVVTTFGLGGSGASLPVATQPGSLAATPPGSSGVKAASITTDGLVKTATVAVTKSSAVPNADAARFAVRRIARSQVAQAVTDRLAATT